MPMLIYDIYRIGEMECRTGDGAFFMGVNSVEEKKRGKGQPRKFDSGEDMLVLYREFCDEIVANDYNDVPTLTSFEVWLRKRIDGCDRKTLYHTINNYYPNVKRDFELIRADVVARGTMQGKYQPSMSIFALKNWCGWTDKQEVQADSKIEVTLAGDLDIFSK